MPLARNYRTGANLNLLGTAASFYFFLTWKLDYIYTH